MEITLYVETQHGIASRAWDEWAVTATMTRDGHVYDWLYADRGGQRLDIADFKRLAPDVDFAKLDDQAVDAYPEEYARYSAAMSSDGYEGPRVPARD